MVSLSHSENLSINIGNSLDGIIFIIDFEDSLLIRGEKSNTSGGTIVPNNFFGYLFYFGVIFSFVFGSLIELDLCSIFGISPMIGHSLFNMKGFLKNLR